MNITKTRKIEISIVIGVFIAAIASFISFSSDCNEIRSNVLRLHIIANSDSEADQNLKLKIRDRILTDCGGTLASAGNEDQAVEIAQEALPEIENAARKEIEKNGYTYSASGEIVNMYFPTKKYDTGTMPAGRYDAVRIVIGEGKGKNWWCVMFPPMCLPAATDQEPLGDVFSESEKDIINDPDRYEVRFKLLEWFESAWNFISGNETAQAAKGE